MAKSLTRTDVLAMVKDVALTPSAAEAAAKERVVYRRVLEALAEGRCIDAKTCAITALLVTDLPFARNALQ